MQGNAAKDLAKIMKQLDQIMKMRNDVLIPPGRPSERKELDVGASLLTTLSKAERLHQKDGTSSPYRRSQNPLGSESTSSKQAKLEPFTTKGTSSVATRKPSASLSDCLDMIDRILRLPVEPGKKTLNIAAKKKEGSKAPGSKANLSLDKANGRTLIVLRIASSEEETTERAMKCLSPLMFAIIEDWIGFETAYEESVPQSHLSSSSSVPLVQTKLDELTKPPKKRARTGSIIPNGGTATKAKRQLFGTISTATPAPLGSSSELPIVIPAEEKLKVGLLNLPLDVLYSLRIDTRGTGIMLLRVNFDSLSGVLTTLLNLRWIKRNYRRSLL